MPVSMALVPFACDRVQPVDLIHGHDLLDDVIFESVLLLAASGLDWGSFSCSLLQQTQPGNFTSSWPGP